MSMATFSSTCSFGSFNDIEYQSATKDLELNGAKNLSKHKISFRKRQLSIGKNTWGYQNYIRTVCKNKRSLWHPRTPDAMERISKRRFKGESVAKEASLLGCTEKHNLSIRYKRELFCQLLGLWWIRVEII